MSMALNDMTHEVQFTIDQTGKVTAIVLTPALWQRILELLEHSEDKELAASLHSQLVHYLASARRVGEQSSSEDELTETDFADYLPGLEAYEDQLVRGEVQW